ncbi:protein of unknown function DUF903 [Desulfovibrio sp. X2]|uniref:YgdI/YgdR family lipoprotein n=1 Tax=Desulfovibrio sp. X2 TaxID=941449 RepID=UPI000358A792|nr:YgdI/YgdR family lipoprotein [Desulfovibrio sp. X2]EPR42129.1 protein of unknown function DUF903 [Desulfovibrio sp. X2]
MKRFLYALVLVLALGGLTACGAHNYTVSMSDGTQYTAHGQPEYDESSKTYTFKDLDGRTVTVPRDGVKSIQEHLKD